MMKNNILTFIIIICSFIHVNLNAQDIGLQLYSLRDQFKEDVQGTFKQIKAWGITKLEDGGGGTYGLSMKAYQQLLKENNTEIVGVSADFETLRDHPEAIIAKVKEYGAAYAVCFWIPHKEDHFDLRDLKNALTVFNNAGKLLKKQGFMLMYHPHGYEFHIHEKATLMEYMINHATDFSFEMDVFWVKHGGADPLSLLRKYPKKFKAIHLKDRAHGTIGNKSGRADVNSNVVLGSGDVGIKALVIEAKKLGIQYLYIEDESSRAVEQIPKSLQFLTQIMH